MLNSRSGYQMKGHKMSILKYPNFNIFNWYKFVKMQKKAQTRKKSFNFMFIVT